MIDPFNIPELLTTYGYVGVMVIVFLESGVFFALPGDSLLFTAGLFAATGLLSIKFLIPMIFVASLLGGLGGYVIGIYIEHLHNYAIFRKLLSKKHLDEAHAFFEKHGMFAIIVSRFVPVVRTFLPIAAGIAQMEFGRFFKYSVLSAALWSIIVTSLGYFLGKEFPNLHNYLSHAVILIVIASVLPLVIQWWRARRGKGSQTI